MQQCPYCGYKDKCSTCDVCPRCLEPYDRPLDCVGVEGKVGKYDAKVRYVSSDDN